jgi:DNA-binding transcriptional LysR family regulator
VPFATALQYDFISLLQGTPIASQVEYESSLLGRTPKIKLHVRSIGTMCRMISLGLGIAVLPEAGVRDDIKRLNLKVISLTDDWAVRQLLVGVRDVASLSPPARLLFDFLLKPRN